MGICSSQSSNKHQSISSSTTTPRIQEGDLTPVPVVHRLTIQNDVQFFTIPIKEVYFEKRVNKYRESEANHMLFSYSRVITHIQKLPQRIDNLKIETQIKNWQQVYHPCIQRHYEVYEDNHAYHLIKQRCRGIPLNQFLQKLRLTEVKFKHVYQRIIEAFVTIHQKKFRHGVICNEIFAFKTMERNSKFKIQSFLLGLKVETTLDTIQFRAPEVIRDQPSLKSDVWSLGVILYFGLVGQMPFQGEDVRSIQNKILKTKPQFEGHQWENVSKEAICLVKKMLEHEERRRPTLSQCLSDRWFNGSKTNLGKKQKLRLQEATEHFKNLNCDHLLQKSVLILMFEILGKGKKITKIYEIFKRIDRERRGALSRIQVQQGLDQVFSTQDTLAIREKLFKTFDTRNQGFITPQHFFGAFVLEPEHFTLMNYERMFKIIGGGKQEYLKEQDILRLLFITGFRLRDVNLIMGDKELQDPEKISLSDFLEIMKKMYLYEPSQLTQPDKID